MKRFFALAIILAALAGVSSAQTVGPAIQELKAGKKPVKGEFVFRNDGLQPLTVVVEPLSFSLDATGKPTFRPLDSSVHIRLSEMSARVGARQVHAFAFEALCDSPTCAFSIYSTVTGQKTSNGIQIALHLPSTTYLCKDSAKGCRARVRRDFGVIEAK